MANVRIDIAHQLMWLQNHSSKKVRALAHSIILASIDDYQTMLSGLDQLIKSQVQQNKHLPKMLIYEAHEEADCVAMKVGMLLNHPIFWLPIIDPRFPKTLLELADCPLGVYYVGAVERLAGDNRIAIVGTRKPTYEGLKMCEDLGAYLGMLRATVISGLAYGIDAQAHKAALRNQAYTIAVLASGLDCVSPEDHKALALGIVNAQGLLVSEYAPGVVARKYTYISRNRLISALAQKVVVVEAAAKSGSLYTAQYALDLGRDLFAVPGSRSNAMSKGVNNLIRQGAIPLIEPEDLIWDERQALVPQLPTKPLEDPILIQIYNLLKRVGHGSAGEISIVIGQPTYKVSAHLMYLACEGWIETRGDSYVPIG